MTYEEVIKTMFPHNPERGFYKKPNMPATQLGRLLMDYPRLKSPALVEAFYSWKGFFKGGHLLVTKERLLFPDGDVRLEDVLSAQAQGDEVVLMVNQGGRSVSFVIKTANEKDAKTLASFFNALANVPKAEQITQKVEAIAKDLNPHEIRWIKLKDAVLDAIEKLHLLYQAGKISLTEWEIKRKELLDRL